MAERKTLNPKRLTKKQVQEIINSEGKLHDEFTEVFREVTVTGVIKQDLVYELPGDRYLRVFDKNESGVGGKGDIFSKEYFRRFVNWIKRIRKDYEFNRGSSVGHWFYYSKYKYDLPNHIETLIDELSFILKIDEKKLDKSYKSLDIVSEKVEL